MVWLERGDPEVCRSVFIVFVLLVSSSSGFHNIICPIVSQNNKTLGNKIILLNVINLANIIKTQNETGTKKCA